MVDSYFSLGRKGIYGYIVAFKLVYLGVYYSHK